MKTFLHSFSEPIRDPGTVPDWLHLSPAGTFSGDDGRGPFELGDAQKVIAASLPAGRKLPIDENHSIDHVAPKGGASPARGWIVELQSRGDGIWGRVEWTGEGRKMMEDKAYGFLSPAIEATAAKPHKVLRLLRASLVNDPNLTTLKSLHGREDVSMEEEIRKALGLPETADQAAIVAAVTTLHAAKKEADALIGTIAEATGAKKDASGEEIVTALNGRLKEAETTGDAAELRKEVVSLNAKLTKLETSTAKERAELLIGRALEEGRLVPALKDHFISRHIKNPAEVETELKATPSLHSGGLKGYKPPATGEEGLSGDDAEICALMGLDPKAFAETAKTMREAL